MTAVYAWIGRHKVLVDSVKAAFLGLISIGSLLNRSPVAVAVVILMIAPVAVRRRYPVASFGPGAVACAWQVLGSVGVGGGWSLLDRHPDGGQPRDALRSD